MYAPRFTVRVSALALVLASLLLAADAEAQQVPPDVVILRDGTMFRGTLVERGAERVVLMLATGEVREFAGADVERAGPDAPPVAAPIVVPVPPPAMAPPVPTPPLPVAPSVRLHVRGTAPGRTLHRLTDSVELPLRDRVSRPRLDAMTPICAAPCDIDLPVGTYVFGVSEGEGSAHRAGPPVHLEAGERWMEIEHDSRTGTRVAGWIVIALGAGAGGALAGFGIASAPPGVGLGGGGAWLGWDAGVWFGLGLATAAVFALIGALLVVTDDDASFSLDDTPPAAAPVAIEEDVEEEEPAPRPRRRREVPDAF